MELLLDRDLMYLIYLLLFSMPHRKNLKHILFFMSNFLRSKKSNWHAYGLCSYLIPKSGTLKTPDKFRHAIIQCHIYFFGVFSLLVYILPASRERIKKHRNSLNFLEHIISGGC